MLLRLLLLVVAVCALGVNSKPDLSSINLVHFASRPADVHNEWVHLNAAPLDRQHRIILALKERNLDLLEQRFHEVSNPKHANWLNHMTREEIHELTAPDDKVVEQVKDWLSLYGVRDESIKYGLATGALEFTADIKTINQLFNTTVSVFQHTKTSKQGLSHSAPTYVPSHLREHIEFADGLHFLPFLPTKHLKIVADGLKKVEIELPRKSTIDQAANDTTSAPLRAFVTPLFPVNSLYAWYNAPDLSSFTKNGQSNVTTNIGVVQFVTTDRFRNEISNNFSPNDMSIYSTIWSNTRNPSTVIVDQTIGPNDPSDPQNEASLDTQAAGAWNPRASLVFENNDSDNFFFHWANSVVSRDNVAQVYSISYGLPEFSLSSATSGSFDGIPRSQYLSRTDNLFMKMGLRGITVLASTGDSGANDRNSACDYTDGYDYRPYFVDVEFPASSPYVTAVGATSISTSNSALFSATKSGGSPICNNFETSVFSQYGIVPQSRSEDNDYWCFNGNFAQRSATTEQAVSLDDSGFTSGGGFSTYYPLPSWQATVVRNYVNNNPGKVPTTRSFFDATKRAIPDISMYGSAFPVIQGSVFTQVGGTSLSAPLMGSIVTQLNEITRRRAGRTLGFINQLLYQMASEQSNTIIDITSGNNKCPQNSTWSNEAECLATAPCQGYTAAVGWDAVTGLGVPNQAQMVSYINGMLDNGWTGGANDTGSTTGLSNEAYNANRCLYHTGIVIVALIASFAFIL